MRGCSNYYEQLIDRVGSNTWKLFGDSLIQVCIILQL